MKYSDPKLVDHLASAYVLGTLQGAARRRFDRLRKLRPDVDLAVHAWQHRLGRLAESLAPVQPSARVWRLIAEQTRPPAGPPKQVRSWWWPVIWGGGGLVAGALAAVLVVLASPAFFLSTDQVAMHSGERLPQSYVGLLTDAQGNGKLLVSSLRHGRVLTIKVIGPFQPPAAGRRLVLWAAPATGAPFIIGNVPLSGNAVSRLPDTSERLLSKVSKLLVTEESADMPAAPGPVVFSGNCAKLW